MASSAYAQHLRRTESFGSKLQPASQFTGSGAWRKLLAEAEKVATHLQVVTIEGEQGTGKQTLGRYLHSRSIFARSTFQRRDAREWIDLDESLPSLAGFIYLDRVDLLASDEQQRLLEVLGAIEELPRGRAALVISSRASLRQLTSMGTLQPDLGFRLKAVHFAIPPLRRRRDDIAPIAQFLLDQLRERYKQPRVSLGSGALARLLQYEWPGNVRELNTTLEAAMINSRNGLIRAEDLRLPSAEDVSIEPEISAQPVANLDLHVMIRDHVKYVLDLNRGNKLRSSRQLGISRSTLYRILGDETVLGR